MTPITYDFDIGTRRFTAYKRLWYLFFALLWMAEICFVAMHMNLNQPLWFWLLLPFAAYHMGRAVSFYGVFEFLRFPFVHEVVDTSGAGNNLEPNHGRWVVIGELITCPVCSITHMASILLTVTGLLAPLGYAMIIGLGIAGMGVLLQWIVECTEWAGRAQRESSGTEWLRKNRGTEIGAYMVSQEAEQGEIVYEDHSPVR